jgi:hypothetical protein
MAKTWWKRSPKVVVGFPVGGSVTLPFHASMQRMVQYELRKPDRERLLGRVHHASSLYVGDNRTLLAQRFIQTDAEWLLQIDTDIEFPPTLLETMVDLAGEDRKVLAASVPLGETYESCGFLMEPGEIGVWRPLTHIPPTPVEVDGIATAVVLIHRDVFLRIAEEHGQVWFHHLYLPTSPPGTPRVEQTFRMQGEDFAFCVRAKDAGFGIYVVHVPGLRHYKTRALSHDVVVTTEGMGALVEA